MKCLALILPQNKAKVGGVRTEASSMVPPLKVHITETLTARHELPQHHADKFSIVSS